MSTDVKTPEQSMATMLHLLDQAADQTTHQAAQCGEQGQWALAVRWDEIGGRIVQIISDTVEPLHSPLPPSEPPGQDSTSVADLLTQAEACTRAFAPGEVPGMTSRMIVEMLDLAREVRSLGS